MDRTETLRSGLNVLAHLVRFVKVSMVIYSDLPEELRSAESVSLKPLLKTYFYRRAFNLILGFICPVFNLF